MGSTKFYNLAVGNFGKSKASPRRNSVHMASIWAGDDLERIAAFAPTAIIVMFGTNDATTRHHRKNAAMISEAAAENQEDIQDEAATRQAVLDKSTMLKSTTCNEKEAVDIGAGACRKSDTGVAYYGNEKVAQQTMSSLQC